jgi:hypothetical protein
MLQVDDVAHYRHGGMVRVLFVDKGCRDGLPYQCCLEGGNVKKNAWFHERDLTKTNAI